MTLYLHGFARSSGTSCDLADFPDIPPARRALLSEGGYRRFIQSRQPPVAMILEAAAASLAACDAALEIDAVIAVTESFRGDRKSSDPAHKVFRDDLLEGLNQISRLRNAPVYGVWMSACGNLLPAMSMACGLVASGQCRNVLILAGDALDSDRPRVMITDTLLYSDIAAACIVGRSPVPGMTLGLVVLHHSANILDVRANYLKRVTALGESIAELDGKVQASTGRALKDHATIIVEAFHEGLVDYVADCIGVPRERIHCPAREGLGHAFSADLLLSIDLMRTAQRSALADPILALSLASWTLGAAILHLPAGPHGSSN